MLEVKNLTKYFGGVCAVSDCSFEIKKGKITALIGPNGSGKSTVFNLISGSIKADSGKIFFNNQDITNLPMEKISNLGISRMFQQARLFKNLSVSDNLLLALDNEDTKFWKNILGINKITEEKKERVRKILKEFGILELENKPASDLSFGQKRLVELARTMFNPHQLLILDEPVAGVNPKIRQNIAKLLLKLKKQGETILLIEHDMVFTLELADGIIVLDAGKVIASGTPKKIKNNKLVLEAYLGS
jgi:ABC-type branched-subunit amino acid transport system ATPase component